MTATAAEQMQASLNAILGIAPDQDAVEFRRRWWTWGTLKSRKDAIEAAIAKAGLGADVRVGVILRNRPEVVSAVLAAVTTERCLVTLNPTLPDSALRSDIAKLRLPVIVASSTDWARGEVREAGLASGALCVEVSDDPEGPVRILQKLSHPIDDFNGLAPGVAVEMLTSGTTGPPKRIPLKRTRFAQSILGAAKFEAGRSKDDSPRLRPATQLLLTPFAHIGGLLALLNALLAGRKTCVLEKFEVSEFQDAVKRHRPKVVQTPPAGLAMVLAAGIPKEDLSSLVAYRTGAAPLDPALADEFWQTYGIPVLQNYGATELGGVAGWTLEDFRAFWPAKRGAVGRLNPGVEARITAAGSSDVLAPGEEGILELKGSQIGDPDQWTATTDLAVLDADGFLWIKGRADATIIRGGFKIQPHSVAQAIESHPAIREAVVVGIADRRLGQVPAAAYTLKPGASAPSTTDLREFLRETLLPYQIPTTFLQLDELPRTASMKVGLQAVRELFEQQEMQEG